MSNDFKDRGNELDWLGPKDEKKHLIYKGQSKSTMQLWYFTSNLLEMDPNYSEFSVRIHDPRCRSLSFCDRTLAILPKSKLRSIHKLIGDYLEDVDEKKV